MSLDGGPDPSADPMGPLVQSGNDGDNDPPGDASRQHQPGFELGAVDGLLSIEDWLHWGHLPHSVGAAERCCS